MIRWETKKDKSFGCRHFINWSILIRSSAYVLWCDFHLDNHLDGRKCCGQVLRVGGADCYWNTAGIQTTVKRSDQVDSCSRAKKFPSVDINYTNMAQLLNIKCTHIALTHLNSLRIQYIFHISFKTTALLNFKIWLVKKDFNVL